MHRSELISELPHLEWIRTHITVKERGAKADATIQAGRPAMHPMVSHMPTLPLAGLVHKNDISCRLAF
jgi:hypothetical protein